MARRGSGQPQRRRQQQLVLLAAFCCLATASAASSKPQPALLVGADLARAADAGGGAPALGRQCWYTVQIKTSCASPARTSDAISLAFGDAYRNEVYAAQLGSPSSRAFESCATDTFRVGGPCGYGVCYLYLRRSGRDGWTPQWVRVYEPTADTPATFYYGDPLPDAVWYGFNRCPHRASSSGAGAGAAAVAAL